MMSECVEDRHRNTKNRNKRNLDVLTAVTDLTPFSYFSLGMVSSVWFVSDCIGTQLV